MRTYPIDQLVRDQGYWYLATPYSKWAHGLEDANTVAQQLTGRLIAAKVPVYSPIAHTHGIALASSMDPLSHDIWMPADQPLFNAAYGLLVADLPGWKTSKGVDMEIEWARQMHKPIWVIDPETLAIRQLQR